MATQNPVELEGTYPLPEAQIDRFLVKLVVPYPDADEEREIVARDAAPPPILRAVVDADCVLALRGAAEAVHVAPPVADYAVRLVRATRDPLAVGARVDTPGRATLGNPVALGASPRASLFLVRAARARALLDGRSFATPHDVKRIAPDVLRHRIVVSYEAEAEGILPAALVEAVLAAVELP
jgi:MoxR-like ATPase